jgi:hypothetical protein
MDDSADKIARRFKQKFDGMPDDQRARFVKVVRHATGKRAARLTAADMKANGSIWGRGNVGKWEGADLSVHEMSRYNYATLLAQMKKLEPEEKAFMRRFEARQFFATHFTTNRLDNEAGNLEMYSRRRLLAERTDIAFNQQHTTGSDARRAYNDDHVFFSLECGAQRQKTSSTFGPRSYRFDFSQDGFRDAWVSLDDMVMPRPNNLEHRVKDLDPIAYSMARLRCGAYASRNYVFAAGHILPGIALALIEFARAMPPKTKDRFLSATTDKEFNDLMNGLFRPELKVARSFASSEFQSFEGAAPAPATAQPSTSAQADAPPAT